MRLKRAFLLFILNMKVCKTKSTMGGAVDPVVAKVYGQEGQPPGPGRVPGQHHHAEVVPHEDVGRQLQAPHEQPETS